MAMCNLCEGVGEGYFGEDWQKNLIKIRCPKCRGSGDSFYSLAEYWARKGMLPPDHLAPIKPKAFKRWTAYVISLGLGV